MKINYSAFLGRLIGLVVVTIFALVVMVASGTKLFNGQPEAGEGASGAEPELTRAAVTVRRLGEPETIDIVETYTGIIEPYKQHRSSFEIGGRLEALGTREVDVPDGQEGETLDVGDPVREGQVLAVLDRRALLARKQETQARREEAEADLARKQNLDRRTPGIVSAEEMQGLITALEVAQAQDTLAEKNLEDATLLSPCDGVIASRQVNPGESVNPNQLVFEILEVDRLRLVVGVPQSRLHFLTVRQAEIVRDRLRSDIEWNEEHSFPDAEEMTFPVRVQLLQQLRPGETSAQVHGFVYRVSEDDDANTGLFPVEILLDNRQRAIRPGQLARVSIIVDRQEGYRLPMATALHRSGKTYVFAVEGADDEVEFMFWDVGEGTDYTARLVEITEWLEQDEQLILLDKPGNYSHLVVRGQHRLVDQRPVRLVPEAGDDEPAPPGLGEAGVLSAEAP